MKKVLLAIAVVALLGIGTSCSKEKTCHCTYTLEVLGISETYDLGDYTIEDGSCSDLENNGSLNAQIGAIAGAKLTCKKK